MGLILLNQPFFIKGIENEQKCVSNAFGAMKLFIVSFAASLVYLLYIKSVRKREINYAAVSGASASEFMLPNGMSDYVANTPFLVGDVEITEIQQGSGGELI